MIPAELKYTKTHEWVREEDGMIVVGLKVKFSAAGSRGSKR